jgi:FkbM family methyltransferase
MSRREDRWRERVPDEFHIRPEDELATKLVFWERIYSQLLVSPEDRVLDLGAHTGSFSVWATDFRPSQVTAVEMMSESAAVARDNAAGLPIKVIEGAVTADNTQDHVTAVIGKRANPMRAYVAGTFHEKPAKNSRVFEVKALPLPHLIEETRPDIIKFSLECGEGGVIAPNAKLLMAAGVKRLTGPLYAHDERILHQSHWLHDSLVEVGYVSNRPPPAKTSGWGSVTCYTLPGQSVARLPNRPGMKMTEEEFGEIPVPPGFSHRYEDRSVTVEVFATHAYRNLTINLKSNEVLLDLGAHIGCVSRYALDRGVAHVVSVEMLPDNIPFLERNTVDVHPGKSTVIHAAVSQTSEPVTAVMAKNANPMGAYVTGSKHETPVRSMKNYRQWTVPAITMTELIARYHPTRLKFDIESSEYLVIDPQMLRDAGVNLVVGEYHVQTPELLEKAHELYARFEACGYEMSRQLPASHTGWGPVITSRLKSTG